jgi:hypothetical protein
MTTETAVCTNAGMGRHTVAAASEARPGNADRNIPLRSKVVPSQATHHSRAMTGNANAAIEPATWLTLMLG